MQDRNGPGGLVLAAEMPAREVVFHFGKGWQMARWMILVPAVLVIGLGVLGVGGIGYALALENQDSFCASCHTEPEVKYMQQSQSSTPATLAAFHRGKQTGCIDCHSGGGLLGRTRGLQQGASDLMMYWSGSYARPAVTTNPLGDDSCTKCHDDVFSRRRGGSRSMNGHYHAFLPRWQAIDANAAHCTTCHPAHPEAAPADQYMSLDRVRQTCEDCHRVLGEGEIE